MESQLVDRMQAERLDRAEDAARTGYVPAAAPEKRNVVLIVVDALRPDHLGVLGYARDTTPNLVRILHDNPHAVAMSLHSSCGESACGLMSLASSKYVHQFSEKPITLSEMLQRYGYRTHFILSGDHAHFYGLREAYGKVDSYFDGSMTRDYYMNDDRLVLDHAGALPAWDGKPVMFQFHLMSAHALGKRLPSFQLYSPAANYAVLTNQDNSGKPSERSVNFYDNGVRQADAMIAQLLQILNSKGYLRNTIVAITADHGELLGEHGMYTHAKSVYEEVLRVPLILLPFGYEPQRPMQGRGTGEQVDIAPTLLHELGMPAPATWAGSPLQDGRTPEFTYFQEAPYAGIYDWRTPPQVWKYAIDMKQGRETVALVQGGQTTVKDGEPVAPPDRLREWRTRVLPTMPSGSAPILR